MLLSNDYTSLPRNKQIASIFKEAGVVEKYGSGIRRIREAFLNAGGREPRSEEIGEGFRVTVYSLDVGYGEQGPSQNRRSAPLIAGPSQGAESRGRVEESDRGIGSRNRIEESDRGGSSREPAKKNPGHFED